MKHDLIYHFLDDDDLLRISNKIKQMERLSSGEIKVSIKEEMNFLSKNKSIEELAKVEFFKLGMDKTRDKTGILIFLLLGQRQFHILADSGINEKVALETWDEIKEEMQNLFQSGNFCDGILSGIDKVGKVLHSHFPIKQDDTNELSNKVEF